MCIIWFLLLDSASMLSSKKIYRLPEEIAVKLGLEKVKDKISALELNHLFEENFPFIKMGEYSTALRNILRETSNERKRLALLGISLILYSLSNDLLFYQKILDLEATTVAKASRIITIDKLLMSGDLNLKRNLALLIRILQNSKLVGLGLTNAMFNRMDNSHFQILGDVLAAAPNITLFCLRYSWGTVGKTPHLSAKLGMLAQVVQRSHIRSIQLHGIKFETWDASDYQLLKIILRNVTSLSLTDCYVDDRFYKVLASTNITSLSVKVDFFDGRYSREDNLEGFFVSIPASLRQLYLSGEGFFGSIYAGESLNALLQRVNIKILTVPSWGLGHVDTWKKFCLGLKNSKVEILHINNFDLGDKDDFVDPLEVAIEANRALYCVKGLTGNVAAIAPALQANFASRLSTFNDHKNEAQVKALAETVSEYESISRWGQVLQDAVANFLLKVIVGNPWRIDHLLLQVSAASLPAREVYGRYFELTYIDAYDKFQSPSAALFKALKFCFDVDNQTVHFTAQMQLKLDIYLQAALGIPVAPNELKPLSAKVRALLWRWLILQELGKILELQTSQAASLAKINRSLPLIDNDAALLVELWTSMSKSLVGDQVRTNKKLQRWLRGLEYANRMIDLANAEKSFTELYQGINTENVVASFLQALPLSLNYYQGFISFSDEHEIMFDKFLGKACGIEAEKLTEVERLALLRFLILRELEGDPKSEKKHSWAFFESVGILLPRINNQTAIDDKVKDDLAKLEGIYKKEIVGFARANSDWQPLYDYLDSMKWQHATDVRVMRPIAAV